MCIYTHLHPYPHLYTHMCTLHCTHTCERWNSDVDCCLAVGTSESKGAHTAVRPSGRVGHTGASKETGICNTSGLGAELTGEPLGKEEGASQEYKEHTAGLKQS